MTNPLRIRTPKETMASNLALRPDDLALWGAILERANDDGHLPSDFFLQSAIPLDADAFDAWAAKRFPWQMFSPRTDVALLYEFWVSQQPDA